ncbi:MAG: hypothetical protein K0R59_3051 [Sphingobacterium sp.]|jgi:hypothetical protein|nr:hypothetical protein [Sphingobacterium sp.]
MLKKLIVIVSKILLSQLTRPKKSAGIAVKSFNSYTPELPE